MRCAVTASGFFVEQLYVDSRLDVVFWRPFCTALVVHPKYPRGDAHYLHPSTHLRTAIALVVAGLPFALSIKQRQGGGSDDSTGFAVWRASTVLASYLVQDLGRRPVAKHATAVELGCGAGAVGAFAAAWLGYDAVATDVDEMTREACESAASYRASAAAARAPMQGTLRVEPLFWGRANAKHFVDTALKGRRCDLILGSEIIYALKETSRRDAESTFDYLIETIDELLALDAAAAAIMCYCPRADIEASFFAKLSDRRFVASPPVELRSLGLAHHQVEGIKIIVVSRAPAAAE
ncbi:putative methyltransferase-domain-containing protein [Pelagophyceae sp. CCMP2097]|nr:putative methyltransferase-domain-containing protein [Pelagophyceae sp. CCMP2097]